VLWVVCTLVIVLLAWAIFAHLDIVAVAQGRLVPQTYVKIVQPAEAGIVREILVDEGDRVKEGQVLVRLDATERLLLLGEGRLIAEPQPASSASVAAPPETAT
jgi:multidrug efflux pump subunit AcrA (membrane-fusion protein)